MMLCWNHGRGRKQTNFILINFLFFEISEIALCGLAIFLCEELKHQRTESPIRPFILFIVECLQVSVVFFNYYSYDKKKKAFQR